MTAACTDGGLPVTSRFTTLVVDDEHDLADVTAELLAYHDIEALVAYSAQEALQVMEARKDIDAIFTDVMMPSMTGIELADVVARVYPDVKIVLTSGYTKLTYWEHAVRHYPLARKPYLIATVIQLLRH